MENLVGPSRGLIGTSYCWLFVKVALSDEIAAGERGAGGGLGALFKQASTLSGPRGRIRA